MREIKFRGKSIKSGEWFEGDAIHCTNRNNEKEVFIVTDDYDGECIIFGTCQSPQVDINTVGRYTGLLDENYKEIYEGDIIDFSYDAYIGNFDTFIAKGIIVFKDGAFYVKCLENERNIKDEQFLLYEINIDEIKIIGNIYDNPELLKEGD